MLRNLVNPGLNAKVLGGMGAADDADQTVPRMPGIMRNAVQKKHSFA